MTRKMSVLMILLLVLGMLLMPAAAGAEEIVTDGPAATGPHYSHRLIVQLSSPSLAEWHQSRAAVASAEPQARLDLAAPAAQAYAQQLEAEQRAFIDALPQAIPGAQVATFTDSTGQSIQATAQTVINAVVVDPGKKVDLEIAERRLRAMPGVKQVMRDYENRPDMYASLPLINAPAMWDKLGGQDMSGEGIIVASVDTGVYAPNPFFDPTGYAYPVGYPKGDVRYTTEKVIGARAYFRPWDPPTEGDEGAWPGPAGSSHGTHTMGTVAGNANTVANVAGLEKVISGVAPRAQILSYRIGYPTNSQYSGSAFTAEIVMAYEDAVKDGAQVINYSFGGYAGVMPWADGVAIARDGAWDAGVFVSHSGGNSGRDGYSTVADASPQVIEVGASSTSGTIAAGFLSVASPEPVPEELTDIAFSDCLFCTPFAVGEIFGPYPYMDVGAVTAEGSQTLCDGEEVVGDLTGYIALISRGGCYFSDKVWNAQQAGAVAAIVYNNAGDGLINMSQGSHEGEPFTIPGAFIGQTDGQGMLAWSATNPGAEAAFDYTAREVGNTPDVMASFSSRGPAFSRYLEPDVTAPGVNILSSGYAPGASGIDAHAGFGTASGTSMAAPHVAGSAVLLRQAHPEWTPSDIMSALMSTSKYLEIYNGDGSPAQPLDMGAGRIDLTNAADPGVILDPPSLSFGSVAAGQVGSIDVKVRSVADKAETYTISTLFTGSGFDALTTLPGMTVTPDVVTLAPGEITTITVAWDTSVFEAPGDYQGFVVLKGEFHDAHMPAWMRVPLPFTGAPVLLIDNDFSDLLGYPDYAEFYTSTLDNLGIPYVYWNADLHFGNAQTIPSAAELAAFDFVIYWSGDNYDPDGTYTVRTPLTPTDLYILSDWQFNGGRLIATGQDLASAWNALDSDGNGYFFYAANLGAGYLQDSLFDPFYAGELPPAPSVVGVPGSPLSGLVLDISGSAPITDTVDGDVVIVGWEDGAANQYYVDEIEVAPYGDVEAPDSVYPLLAAADGYQLDSGYVAAARGDSPTLEHGLRYPYRSIYLSFGFEGINNNTGFNTREELAAASYMWLADDVAVTLTGSDTVENPYDLARFEADLVSSVNAPLASCRWDMGDGSPIVENAGPVAGYVYGAPGIYTVRVQCNDSLGFGNVAEMQVEVKEAPPVYTTPMTAEFAAAEDTYLAFGLPASNFGDWAFLYVGGDDALRSVVKFDLSSIDPAYPVQAATLKVYVDAYGGGGTPAELRVYDVTSDWAEATATWNAPWAAAGGDYVEPAADGMAITKDAVGTWVEFDVTDLAAQWVADPAANDGVILRLRDTTSYTMYRLTSSEYWADGFAPTLTVDYLAP